MNKLYISLALSLLAATAFGQIDPEKRQLVQVGYNQPIEGKAPISGYAFYYRNDPGFPLTNTTLRLAIAPVYVDGELGFHGSEETDWSVGAAGGGFADSFFELRKGNFFESESFTGHGGELSSSVFHRFNPSQMMPLNGILKATGHYSTYERDSQTAPGFTLPDDRFEVKVRAGLRLGGVEPIIFPRLGAELSAWYEGQFRSQYGTYGFNDRKVEPRSHLFWGRGLLAYTLPNDQNFNVSLTVGTSIDPDRFSAYRLGGVLPLSSEFPLTLPGYYHQEISAQRFALLTGQYNIPLDPKKNWTITTVGSIAKVSYVPGMEQPGRWHSGLGIGLGYRSPHDTYKIVVGYSYGFDAIRDHGRGAQAIGLLFQWDLEARNHPRAPLFDIDSARKSRGLFEIFRE